MNKVSNENNEFSNIPMTDKDYATMLLTMLKDISKNYTISLTEASNEILYNKYKDMYVKYINMQRNLFEEMYRKGWYNLEKVEDNKLTTKYNTLNNEFNSIRNY